MRLQSKLHRMSTSNREAQFKIGLHNSFVLLVCQGLSFPSQARALIPQTDRRVRALTISGLGSGRQSDITQTIRPPRAVARSDRAEDLHNPTNQSRHAQVTSSVLGPDGRRAKESND